MFIHHISEIDAHLELQLLCMRLVKVVANPVCLRNAFWRTDEEFLKADLRLDVHF